LLFAASTIPPFPRFYLFFNDLKKRPEGGGRKAIKRLGKAMREALKLPPYVFQALVGIMLGDDNIQQRSLTSNARLFFSQTAKEEKREYFY